LETSPREAQFGGSSPQGGRLARTAAFWVSVQVARAACPDNEINRTKMRKTREVFAFKQISFGAGWRGSL